MMRMIVVGAGPIGGIIGGRLARQGNDLTLVDIDEQHVAAIEPCIVALQLCETARKQACTCEQNHRESNLHYNQRC